ncbi:RNA polymerase sigma-70 factor (sigma-E family) [Antricoccus suffuscus]|uniref:RNA polymerase sigma-70 factor (Sigma-E family) n=1 Tax=Antricoccus suffuscus TaxID=1629062 RepID=A0A2T0Z4V7_9ACTN|nr:SigE family RNA polymerase sigma factor [Antricoccus suffuscus]PRZ31387.1 RNA polymerase sigma-70 factor (sigma-E family) [Antricoccus suffuscus]
MAPTPSDVNHPVTLGVWTGMTLTMPTFHRAAGVARGSDSASRPADTVVAHDTQLRPRGYLAVRQRDEPVYGDADEALTKLYTEHYRSLVRLAATLLDDPGASEEVVQDAYVKMYGAWKRIREPAAAIGYLRTTVLNLARSRMRRRLVARKHAPKPPPDAPSAESGAMESIEQDRVLAELHALPARQKEVLVLRYYNDLSESQIADTLGISKGSVKTHASRGMTTLRAQLGERIGGAR